MCCIFYLMCAHKYRCHVPLIVLKRSHGYMQTEAAHVAGGCGGGSCTSVVRLGEIVCSIVGSDDAVHCTNEHKKSQKKSNAAAIRAQFAKFLRRRARTCSINNEQPRAKQCLEARRLHQLDIGQTWNDVYDEGGQARSLEAQDDAHIVGCKGNADDRHENGHGANNLRDE